MAQNFCEPALCQKPIELTSDASSSAVGISLRLDHHTAACITQDNEIVTVASIESSDAWKEFFLGTLRKNMKDNRQEPTDRKAAVTVISSALSDIQKATKARLGEAAEIGVLTNSSFAEVLAQTAYTEYPLVENSSQIKSYLNCVRLAYSLNTPEALGYDPGFDIEDSNCLLHFNYETEFLEVSIVGVARYYNVRERVFRIDGFGGTDNAASVEDITNMKNRLRTLLDDQARGIGSCTTKLEDYRWIVFSGEAAASEFGKIRVAVTEVVPDFADRFLDSVDPLWVSAIGAARLAQENTLHPPVLK